MFSNSLKYSLRAISFLSKNEEDGKIGLQKLSENVAVPNAYLGKIMQKLVKNDFVSSAKGPRGGFYLTRENRNTPVIRLIYFFEGDDFTKNCVLNFDQCNLENPCPLHHIYIPFSEKLKKKFSDLKLEDLKNGDVFPLLK